MTECNLPGIEASKLLM